MLSVREGVNFFCSTRSVYYNVNKEIVTNILEVLMFQVRSPRCHVSTQ